MIKITNKQKLTKKIFNEYIEKAKLINEYNLKDIIYYAKTKNIDLKIDVKDQNPEFIYNTAKKLWTSDGYIEEENFFKSFQKVN